MQRLFAIAVLLSVSAHATAAELRYGATEHQSVWESESSPLKCRLRHPIPAFGEAVFEENAGGRLGLTLHAWQRPFRTGEARLLSVPPPWRHGEPQRDLGTVDFADDKPPFHMPQPSARRLLLELERGMFPTLVYTDWADGADRVQVHLSSVNVRQALGEFRTCVDHIIPFAFEHVQLSRIHFDFDKAELTVAARARLDEVARYASADPAIRRIDLGGHTDNRGGRQYNHTLGIERAKAVQDYLIAKGLDPNLFRPIAHGEGKPIATNRTEHGRAQNRRVEIELIR